jgi:N-acetylneuraminate synthase
MVEIAEKTIGETGPIYIIAEIGINHNGSLDNAKKLIAVAAEAGCDAVKFQKRTVDVVYTQDELAAERESVFGKTNGDLKRGLEFGVPEYEAIDAFCRERSIHWFASCWDELSVDFIEKFDPPCYKIASASLTDDQLLEHHRQTGKPIILSTGMSDLPMIEHAVEKLCSENLILLHCTSTYPSNLDEINLNGIKSLKKRFPNIPVGFSGHETGLPTTLATAALGVRVIERHITLDRAQWGSDQAASLEPNGLIRLVKGVRAIEQAMGDGEIMIYESERPIIKKLRRIG